MIFLPMAKEFLLLLGSGPISFHHQLLAVNRARLP